MEGGLGLKLTANPEKSAHFVTTSVIQPPPPANTRSNSGHASEMSTIVIKGTINDRSFQTSLFSKPPDIFFCIFRENPTVKTCLYINFLGNSMFLERDTRLCYWELIITGDNFSEVLMYISILPPFGKALFTFLNIELLI